MIAQGLCSFERLLKGVGNRLQQFRFDVMVAFSIGRINQCPPISFIVSFKENRSAFNVHFYFVSVTILM